MKSFSKRILAIFTLILVISSMSVNTFATNRYYNRGYQYGGAEFKYSVNLKSSRTQKITVVNYSKYPLSVQIGGNYKFIAAGREATAAFWSNGRTKVNVLVQANGGGLAQRHFRIKTTGNYDTISQMR